MKNLLLGILATVFFVSAIKAQPLAEKIAKNQNFIKLQLANEKIFDMPNSSTFVEAFDSKKLNEGGEKYLSEITGFSINEISQLAHEITKSGQDVLSDFPELTKMSQEERDEVIEVSTASYLSSQKISAACMGCKRKGLSSMTNQTFLGLLAGGSLGGAFALWTGWIGATLGFWEAAESALDCIRQYC